MITEQKAVYVQMTQEASEEFKKSWLKMTDVAHGIAIANGFWEDNPNKGEKICLMHAELSEALEAIRENAHDDKIPQFLGEEAELADAIIRIMDYDRHFSLRIADAIVEKMIFNASRPYKHGKKF